MKVQFRKLDPRAVTPTYGSADAAGADLYALLDTPLTLAAGETALVHTGLAVEIPAGYVGLVCARSGLAVKHGLALSNGVGVIDSDYRGEIQVGLVNLGSETYTLQPGERLAQLMILPVAQAAFVQADTLDETDRGAGGFGSTGR